MSVYDDVLLSVIAMAEEATPYASIIIGPLPPDNGLCMAWGAVRRTRYTLIKTRWWKYPFFSTESTRISKRYQTSWERFTETYAGGDGIRKLKIFRFWTLAPPRPRSM